MQPTLYSQNCSAAKMIKLLHLYLLTESKVRARARSATVARDAAQVARDGGGRAGEEVEHLHVRAAQQLLDVRHLEHLKRPSPAAHFRFH